MIVGHADRGEVPRQHGNAFRPGLERIRFQDMISMPSNHALQVAHGNVCVLENRGKIGKRVFPVGQRMARPAIEHHVAGQYDPQGAVVALFDLRHNDGPDRPYRDRQEQHQ